MILEDLSFLEGLALESYPHYFGKKRKPKHRRPSASHRSYMMLNPLSLKHLNRIDSCQADAITLNLEDAIAPSRKREALYHIALFLSHLEESRSMIIVRVNPLDEGGEEEIRFLNDFGFDAVRLPKVTHPAQIEQALNLLSPDKELHISLESREALADIAALRIDPRLTTANLGILDLLTSLGLPQSLVTLGNPTVAYLLAKFLIESQTAGIHPVSFMFQQYEETESFREWCLYEKEMGFRSKACMGPRQVALANEVFGDDPEAYRRAVHIKNAFEAQAAKGVHGFMDPEYGFIDEPIYRDALLYLEG